MTRYIKLFLFLGITTIGVAQQRPHYTQYMLNQYILNPALSGVENYADIRLSHRQQWQGLEGAPVTTYFTFNAPIGKQDYKTSVNSFAVEGYNPRGKSYFEQYESSPAHHGIGVQVLNDKAGPFNTTSAFVTYAYHIGLSAKTNLSAGFGAGLSRMNLNTSKLNFGNGVNIDPSIRGTGEIGKMQLDMNAGIYLYSANYFLGASMLQAVPQPLDYAQNPSRKIDGRTVPHFFATTGYRFLISQDVNMVPSVLVKYLEAAPLQADLNLKFQYRDVLWVGGSYRSLYGFAGIAGIRAFNSLIISYSYDYTTTRLNTVSNGSHEIMLGFMIGNKYSQNTCPSNVF